MRRCAVTGATLPREAMIRFVAAPDNGLVTPDITTTLPGRGVWVTAAKTEIDTAAQRNVFARSLGRGAGQKVTVPPDLAATCERLLANQCLNLLGLARRSGDAIFGYEKCRAYLEAVSAGKARISTKNIPLVALRAADISDHAEEKFSAMLRHLPAKLAVYTACVLTGDELARVFNRARVAHVIVRPGGLAGRLFVDTGRLSGLRETRLNVALDEKNE